MSTIAQIFNLALPKPYSGYSATIKAPHPSLLYGVELEIEQASYDWEIDGVRATEDGSLRNGGAEFITRPMTLPVMIYRINSFFESAKENGFNPDVYAHYSERTSIHVHTNCLDLTIEQVKSILLLYQVVESLLFNFIGNDRDKNIFCVPWSQTTTSHNTLQDLASFIKYSTIERNKYTALNITPLKSLGTIEWRHMAGEYNLERLQTWLTIIGHFYRVATTNTLEDIKRRLLELNTTSHYDLLLTWLFQELSDILRYPGYKEDLENGVLDMKYSIINEGVKSKKQVINDKIDSWKPVQDGEVINNQFADWVREAYVRAGGDLLREPVGQAEEVIENQVFNNNNFMHERIRFVQQRDRRLQRFGADAVDPVRFDNI